MALASSTTRSGRSAHSSWTATRMAIIGLSRAAFLGLAEASPVQHFIRSPKDSQLFGIDGKNTPEPAEDAEFWVFVSIAVILVLLGGVFAGLTIALMGQDGVYLQVIAASGEGQEQKHAQKVLRLLVRGKHWVLVALLLSNVIVNESLPIVLDRSLGGGWPAVLGSTVLIVIFGEVIPQSVCVRYGLQIGAFMSSFVLMLMYVLAPIAWPTAKLLDRLLGEDHGTVYKKSGLKTLVTLHKTLGPSPSDRLNQDEVVIISAVLDLKDKAVGDVMTPMEDVFTMSYDAVLDVDTMNTISGQGYSRIPIYEPGNPNNFVGMLLVKILITYDPEDCKRVSDFPLATLPETRPETSCLDILNFFQEGKSHMVLVSDYPGDNHGATGVVTLEDVIEELIGEEIIDESDVYIDVHKAIRRLAPAPTAYRAPKGHVVETRSTPIMEPTEETLLDLGSPAMDAGEAKHRRIGSLDSKRDSSALFGSSPKATFVVRRASGSGDGKTGTFIVRANANDMKEHLKHLGPSNLASRPKTTRFNTVKIKPGHPHVAGDTKVQIPSTVLEPYHDNPTDQHNPEPAAQGGEDNNLLTSAGREASDGVQALRRQSYGTMNLTSPGISIPESKIKFSQTNFDGPADGDLEDPPPPQRLSPRRSSDGDHSGDTLGSLKSHGSGSQVKKKNVARSGSITENYVHTGGVRKVVLETNSSSEDAEETIKAGGSSSKLDKQNSAGSNSATNGHQEGEAAHSVDDVKRKKRRRHRKKGHGGE